LNALPSTRLNPDNPANGLVLQAMETTAKALNVELQPFETRGPSEFERAFAAMADPQIGAVEGCGAENSEPFRRRPTMKYVTDLPIEA
jgi:hypothetical protein